MIDELCPIQFIEGVNEYTISTPDLFDLSDFKVIAIKYQPKLSYNLRNLSIYLMSGMGVQPQSEIRIALHSNYNDIPSDIVLSEGTFKLPLARERPIITWQEINLKPVVVFHSNTYWLVIDVSGYYRLCKNDVNNAIECQLKVIKISNKVIKWENIDENPKLMLKFYGRALTFIS
jgi:hypothetical protein